MSEVPEERRRYRSRSAMMAAKLKIKLKKLGQTEWRLAGRRLAIKRAQGRETKGAAQAFTKAVKAVTRELGRAATRRFRILTPISGRGLSYIRRRIHRGRGGDEA